MDIYEQAYEYFAGIPAADEWEEAKALVHRIASQKPYRSQPAGKDRLPLRRNDSDPR
jgi:hypothetical protein